MLFLPSLFSEPKFHKIDILYMACVSGLGIIGNILYTVAVR